MKTCNTCGRPTSRGWSCGIVPHGRQCLVCWTAAVMQTFVWPKPKPTKNKTADEARV